MCQYVFSGDQTVVRIKELANKIGVSPTTVSHALNGRGRISPSTRKMVLQKVEELGYTPNLNAQRLVTGRSQLIALDALTHGAGHDPFTDLFTMQLARAVVSSLTLRDYNILLNMEIDPKRDHTLLRQWVQSRAVDGSILLCGPRMPEELLQYLTAAHHPTVVIAHQPARATQYLGSVIVGLRAGMQQVARLLFEHGHRRIGFIDRGFSDPALSSFADELAVLGIPFGDDNVVVAEQDAESGAQCLRRLISQPSPPTAVVARSDILAIGALGEAKRLGLRVPQDLSIVGHDDLPLVMLADPALTTVRVDCVDLGREATNILFKLLDDPFAVIPPKTVDTFLVVRETVGPAPA